MNRKKMLPMSPRVLSSICAMMGISSFHVFTAISSPGCCSTTDFTKLCRYRSSVHYTLYVNSHRDRADLGFAEAFLRFDAETYCGMHRAYVEALREAKSPLVDPARIRPS